MQVFDGEEGMLVDRVAMIEVADDEGFNSFEFRQKQSEQTQRVHGAQGVGGGRLQQRLLQIEPEFSASWRRRGERRQSLLDFVFGGGAQLEAVLGHEVKKAEELFRILGRSRLLEKDQAIDHRKIVAGNLSAPSLKLPVQGGPGGWDFLDQLRADAVDAAHMAEVDSHPVGGLGNFHVGGADSVGGSFFLRVPAERVVAAAMAKVQEAAYRHLEIERGIEGAAR